MGVYGWTLWSVVWGKAVVHILSVQIEVSFLWTCWLDTNSTALEFPWLLRYEQCIE